MNVLSFNLTPKLSKRRKDDEAKTKTKAIRLKKAKKGRDRSDAGK